MCDRDLKPTRSRPEHSAASFCSGSEDALSTSAIPEGNGMLLYAVPRFPETNLMPKPTHPWHQNHSDEWEDDFQEEEVCNDPRKEASTATVMENGIKPPSLSYGAGAVARPRA